MPTKTLLESSTKNHGQQPTDTNASISNTKISKMRGRRNLSIVSLTCVIHLFLYFNIANAWMTPTQVLPVKTRQSSSIASPSSLAVVSSRVLEGAFRQRQDNQLYMPSSLLPPKKNHIANSTHRLTRLQIQKAINDIKRFVEARLESDLHLTKVRHSRRLYK